jgi:hypothetical protein
VTAVAPAAQRRAGAVARAGLVLLALNQALVGAWALLGPASFYGGFPLPGHAWVALLPPYNEHLVRDVGGLTLALAVVLAAAAVRADVASARVAVAAFAVFAVPHAVFHALHLEGFPPADALAQQAGFGVQLLLALVVLATARGPAVR